jgi:hypothetical protein
LRGMPSQVPVTWAFGARCVILPER